MVVGDQEISVQGGQRVQDGQFSLSPTLNKRGPQFIKYQLIPQHSKALLALVFLVT